MEQQSFVRNAADKKQVRHAKRKQESKEERQLNDVRYILNDERGRRFLWRYLNLCGVFRSSFTGNFETYFNEGERNVGLKMLADVNEAAPEVYAVMVKEARDREKKDD